MICVVQRVKKGSVIIGGNIYSEISKGFVVLCGFAVNDTFADIEWSVNKIINLRIFENQNGRFDLSIDDVGGEVLIVSQFTLLGDILKGRRPDFTMAMPGEKAKDFYNYFVDFFRKKYVYERVKTGVFQADMMVEIHNDGPVTIIVDSSRR